MESKSFLKKVRISSLLVLVIALLVFSVNISGLEKNLDLTGERILKESDPIIDTVNVTTNNSEEIIIDSNVTQNLNLTSNVTTNETRIVEEIILEEEIFVEEEIVIEEPIDTTTSITASQLIDRNFLGDAFPPSVKKTFITINGITLASKQSDEPRETYYYLQDHLGSNKVIVNNQNIVWTNDYYAFGEQNPINTDDFDNPYQFTGKPLDLETGLNYYGARYYDSDLGRFIQPDALRGNLGNPLSLNRFSYVQNNPLKFVDLTGNQETELTEEEKKQQLEDEKFTALMQSILSKYLYNNPELLKKLAGWKFIIRDKKISDPGIAHADTQTKTIVLGKSLFTRRSSSERAGSLTHEIVHAATEELFSKEEMLNLHSEIDSVAINDLSQGICVTWECGFQAEIVVNRGYGQYYSGYSDGQYNEAIAGEYLSELNRVNIHGGRFSNSPSNLDKWLIFGDSLYNSKNYVKKYIATPLDSVANAMKK